MAMDLTYRAFGLNIAADFDLKIEKTQSDLPDLIIRKFSFQLPPTEKTKVFRADNQAEIAITPEFVYLRWPQMVSFRISEQSIDYQSESNLPDGLLRVFILSEAIGIVLFLKGYFLLHGSAVEINRHSTVFLGLPGAGKSTTVAAYAVKGYPIISDDLVAIELENSLPKVIRAFSEIKIWKDTAQLLGLDTQSLQPAWEGKEKYILKPAENQDINEKSEVDIIVILRRPFSRIKGEIEGLEKITTLISYFPLPHQLLSGARHQQYFQLAATLSQTLPLFYKPRPKTIKALLRSIKNR